MPKRGSHGGADFTGAAPGGGRRKNQRDLPEHGISEADVLRLEEEVRRAGTERTARAAAVARGERQAEAVGRRSVAGPAYAAGDRPKKAVRPRHRRELGRWTQAAFQVSERRVSRLLPIQLATLRYRSRRDPQEPCGCDCGSWRPVECDLDTGGLTVLLKREGWTVNAKRIYRLYTEEGLAVRTKQRKKIARRQRVPLLKATRPNERWSMDFVSDRLVDGRWFRVLTVVDQFTRECLTAVADSSLTGEKWRWHSGDRRRARSADINHSGQRQRVRQRAMDAWAYRHGVHLDFIRPGRPVENGYIESSTVGCGMSA